MKTKFLLVSLLLSFTVSTFAQMSGVATRNNFEKNSNWFITLAGGGQVMWYFDGADKTGDFTDKVTVMPSVSIGKWLNPNWGIRARGEGGALHTFPTKNENVMVKNQYYNIHIDALWNVMSYKPRRVFNFIPYVGVGFAHRFENDQKFPAGQAPWLSHNMYQNEHSYQTEGNAITVNGGFIFSFRLAERVNFDIDLGLAAMPGTFTKVLDAQPYHMITSASGGFTFKLGDTEFQPASVMDYGLINDLNNRINALREENNQLSKRPVSCPECPKVVPPAPVKEINHVSNVVFFRLNSANIDENQQISVYNTAQFVKETGEKIRVVGYADRQTGTAAYNMKLSERRAKAVAKELTTKYNVPSDKIIVEWKGSDEQPYAKNNWNRVVIMSAD